MHIGEMRLTIAKDRSAFANAYVGPEQRRLMRRRETDNFFEVSGLKESLGLVGNQYSILIAMFTAGCAVTCIR